MANRTIIFPHIPKCGGTTLRSQFETTELDVFYDYDHAPHYRQYYREQCERRNWEFSKIDFSEFDIVFGHFPVERYVATRGPRVVLLRHPVDRAISHYFYYKYQVPETNAVKLAQSPIIREIKDGKVDLIGFVRRAKMSTFFDRYLGDSRVDDFALVGFTNQYEQFCDRLADLIDIDIDSSVVMRKGTKDPVSTSTRSQLEHILRDDISVFESFRSNR